MSAEREDFEDCLKAIDKDALMGAEPDMRRAAGDIAMHSLEECVGEFFSG